MRMKLFASTLLLLIAVTLAGPAAALQCGWVPVGDKQCASNITLNSQSGYTEGTDFLAQSGISDSETRNNARDLHPGETDIVVDRHGICRYLTDTGANIPQNNFFVPFRTAPEWIAFLDQGPVPNPVLAVPCALPKDSHITSQCGDLDFTWQQGKAYDVQHSFFSYTMQREWMKQNYHSWKTTYEGPPCTPIKDSKGKVTGQKCTTYEEFHEECQDSSTTTTTSCTTSLQLNAAAEFVGAPTNSGQSSHWGAATAYTFDVSSSCDPPPPTTSQCTPDGTTLCVSGVLTNSCGSAIGTCATTLDGVCGGSDGDETTTTAPSLLCAAGTPTAPVLSSDHNHWLWTCKGSGATGHNASCQTAGPGRIDGQCGASDGTATTNAVPSSLCSAGTATSPALSGDNQHWLWQCAGSGGGTTAACQTSGRVCPAVTDQVCTATEVPVDNGKDANNCPKAKGCAPMPYEQCNALFPGFVEIGCSQCGENWDWYSIYHPDPRCCAIELVPGCAGYVDPNGNQDGGRGSS